MTIGYQSQILQNMQPTHRVGTWVNPFGKVLFGFGQKFINNIVTVGTISEKFTQLHFCGDNSRFVQVSALFFKSFQGHLGKIGNYCNVQQHRSVVN
jgi:hypothetical protein